MAADSIIVRCSWCKTKNRIPRDKITGIIKCGNCKKTMPPISDTPVHATSKTFAVEALHAPMPVIVDFWAAWCGPCLMIAPDLERIAKEYVGKLKVVKVDSDKYPEIAGRYTIQAIPTLLVFKNGKLIDRMTGALPYPQLKQFIKRFI